MGYKKLVNLHDNGNEKMKTYIPEIPFIRIVPQAILFGISLQSLAKLLFY